MPEPGPADAPRPASVPFQPVVVPTAGDLLPPSAQVIPQGPYKYKKPVRERVSLFGWSTLIFIGVCAFGYYKWDEYQPPPPPVKPKGPLREVPTNANPLTAFKQAKDIIQKAGDKQKATYDEVAAMDKMTASDAPDQKLKPASGGVAIVAGSTVTAAPASSAGVSPESAGPAVSREVNNIVKASDVAAVPPSAAFKKWATKLKIGGMRPGANPRVFIERTTYEVGDLVEPQMGIRFEGYNPETRLLRFRDRSGAVVEVWY
jgi:hypothetical protein